MLDVFFLSITFTFFLIYNGISFRFTVSLKPFQLVVQDIDFLFEFYRDFTLSSKNTIFPTIFS